MTAQEFADKIGEDPPTAMDKLMNIIFIGCDRRLIIEKAGYVANTPEISTIAQHLQVRSEESVLWGPYNMLSRRTLRRNCCMLLQSVLSCLFFIEQATSL